VKIRAGRTDLTCRGIAPQKCSSIAPPKTERRRAPHVFYFYLILNNAAVPRIVFNNLMHLLYLFVNAISINAQNAVFFFHLIFLF